MIYFCSQQNRRTLVLQHPGLNGIDYLEVAGEDAGGGCGKTLLVTMLKDARAADLGPAQVAIGGGGSNAQVQAVEVLPGTDEAPKVVTVQLNQSGDFSTYTFALVANAITQDPPDGFDPQLSTVDFSFKAGCPTVGDCLPTDCCPPAPRIEPDINYLAKDYDGFRQVMLDRLAVLVPGWTETHASDVGIALVEILAYAADHLSYQQDASGTEAYIGTARSRISLRRHAKLVDYQINEGNNARVWVYLDVNQDGVSIPAGTLIFPLVPGQLTTISPNSAMAQTLLNGGTPGFATMVDAALYQDQNKISFYTWSDTNCCLVSGATTATLTGSLTHLSVGSVLIFEEVLGPETGNPGDADPTHRWVVRLTQVQLHDYKGLPLVDPLNGNPITRIWWGSEDALPFPLCISSTTDAIDGSLPLSDVSVARGNIIAADHGIWQGWEDLGVVPAATAAPVTETSCNCGSQSSLTATRPRNYPQLSRSPLTFTLPYNASGSATSFLGASSSDSISPTPQITVQDDQGRDWAVVADLLTSNDQTLACVAEIESDGTVFLRFGDGQYGAIAETNASFQAYYRVGNGTPGNVGRDSLAHILTSEKGIVSVRNPLAAAGGVDPETMEQIRQQAPFAFRTQLRAVTEADYGTMAQQDPAISAARGTLRWTGSWYTAFVSIDAAVGDVPTPSLIAATKARLNLLRMAGVDLEVEGAVIVGLRIEMSICVDPDHFQGDVEEALMQLFTTGNLCNGRLGILNPENFTFGQTVYSSPLIAAAQGVEGVSSATMTLFQRMDDPSIDGASQGFLTMGRLEIARCDNDPNRLDYGIFVLHMGGGK